MLKYGHFAADDLPFVVTDPATPRAFDNFLWNDSVMSCVQQTGVGYCDIQVGEREGIQLFTGVGRVCDLEAYGRDHLMSRLVYLRDLDSGEFWNLGWEPVCRDYDSYACEHGLGYTRIVSTTCGIRGELLLLVPPGDAPVELWQLTVANLSGRARRLAVFVYNQYLLAYKWGFESYGDMLYRGATFDREANAMVIQKHPYLAPHEYLTGFLAADRPVDGYDGSRRFFVGDYATLAAPQAVVRGRCSDTPGSCEATIAALQFNLDLAPGGSESIALVNGLADGVAGVRHLARQHLGRIDQAWQELALDKRRLAAHNAVQTPDPHFDRLVNGWMKQQALFGATWCRWGYMGYRDIVQHGYGVSSFAPARTRQILLDALAHMRRNGVALRGWNPVDTKPYSDSCLWLVYTLTAYLKETGDFALLEERVPYYDNGVATVLHHLDTALEFLEANQGSHGLCLIKFGDWNDSLTNIGKEGRGESVWLSMAYVQALDQMADLHAVLGNASAADGFRLRAGAMRSAIRAHAWDGEWFLRCFDDLGQPVGSQANREGRIYLNAQSWALIAGIADARQRDLLLAAVDRLLRTEVGHRLLAPPYTERDDRIGRITYLEPGICENGTVYSHANAFYFLAQLLAGLPDQAYDTFRRLTPGYVDAPDSPKQAIPPYVYANGYYAPEHRNSPLQAEFTWITGSIAWWYNAILDHLLGVRREYDGLTIAPCLPSAWPQASIRRSFRGRLFQVDIQRTGRRSLTLNGRPLAGDFIPLGLCQADNQVVATV